MLNLNQVSKNSIIRTADKCMVMKFIELKKTRLCGWSRNKTRKMLKETLHKDTTYLFFGNYLRFNQHSEGCNSWIHIMRRTRRKLTESWIVGLFNWFVLVSHNQHQFCHTVARPRYWWMFSYLLHTKWSTGASLLWTVTFKPVL